MQPHFDFCCSTWYPDLGFYLNLDKMAHISLKEFETLNWLPVLDRFNQCVKSMLFKYVNDMCFDYQVMKILPIPVLT